MNPTPSVEQKKALKFRIYGPIEVKAHREAGGKVINDHVIRAFWERNTRHGSQRGCYVFAIRTGPAIIPGYVGKATKSFRQEAFTNDKLAKYYSFMALFGKGSPVLFFVVAQPVGRPNGTAIAKCERYLIRLASRASPDLINKMGLAKSDFLIPHVTDFGAGRPSEATRELQKMLLLRDEGPKGQYRHAQTL
jgi:hypothetical protein